MNIDQGLPVLGCPIDFDKVKSKGSKKKLQLVSLMLSATM